MYRVSIPATSGNMGVGFDSTGLAIDLFNTIEFKALPSGLVIEAPDAPFPVPLDGRNLVYRAAKETASYLKQPLPGLFMRQYSSIPHTRGLGSSAACIVGGILIADTLLDASLSKQQMLEIATKMEGHPDNAAPALYGGVCISVKCDDGYLSQPITLAPGLGVAAIVPSFTLSTKKAREVLPRQVSVTDAVSNIGRMGLLVSALQNGDFSLLHTALDDRLHQPYRKSLIEGYSQVEDAAYRAGAYGVCLSGAGPTLLAFFPLDKEDFASLLEQHLSSIPGNWKPMVTQFNQGGAFVEN